MTKRQKTPMYATRNAYGFLRGGPSEVGRRIQVTPDVCVQWDALELFSEDGNRILQINADVWHRSEPARIGCFRGFVLFPTKEDLSISELYDICDAHSQELTDFASAIYGSGIDVQGLCEGGELVFAELLELLPAWQGKGVGMSVLRMILSELRRRFHASTCIIRPEPLQYASPYPTGSHLEAAKYRASKKRLVAYYRKQLGARRLARNSKYYSFRFS